MKKLLFALCLFLTAAFTSTAQKSFAPGDAEWWFSHNVHYENKWINWSGSGSYYTTRTYVNGDTVIDGTPCRRLSTEYMRRRFNDTTTYYGTGQDWYFYDNTDTVFYYNTIFNKFTPLYIFNAQEGDTICLPVVPAPESVDNDLRIHPFTGDTSFCFRMDSIRTEIFDGVPLRVFYTYAIGEYDANHLTGGMAYPTYNWSDGLFSDSLDHYFDPKINRGKYIEKIIGPFFPKRLLSTSIVDDDIFMRYLPDGILNCYSDDSTYIHLSDSACDYLDLNVVFSVKDIKNNLDIVIYPNPAKDILYIKNKRTFSTNFEVHITDITGKILKTYTALRGTQELVCNISELKQGMYILLLTDGVNKYYKKIVKE